MAYHYLSEQTTIDINHQPSQLNRLAIDRWPRCQRTTLVSSLHSVASHWWGVAWRKTKNTCGVQVTIRLPCVSLSV
jgi:hypothetical protein